MGFSTIKYFLCWDKKWVIKQKCGSHTTSLRPPTACLIFCASLNHRWECRGECLCGAEVADSSAWVFWSCLTRWWRTWSLSSHGGSHQDLGGHFNGWTMHLPVQQNTVSQNLLYVEYFQEFLCMRIYLQLTYSIKSQKLIQFTTLMLLHRQWLWSCSLKIGLKLYLPFSLHTCLTWQSHSGSTLQKPMHEK